MSSRFIVTTVIHARKEENLKDFNKNSFFK